MQCKFQYSHSSSGYIFFMEYLPLYEDFFQRIAHTSPDCLNRHGFLWCWRRSLTFCLLFELNAYEDRMTICTEQAEEVCDHKDYKISKSQHTAVKQ